MPLLFLSHTLYSALTDWLIFKGDHIWRVSLNTVNSLPLSQLLYNLSLIELCSVCLKQNTALKTQHQCLFIVSKIDILLNYSTFLLIAFNANSLWVTLSVNAIFWIKWFQSHQLIAYSKLNLHALYLLHRYTSLG